MNSKQKGNAVERKFHKIILKIFDDDQVDKARAILRPIGKGRFASSRNDFFGLFDFLIKDRDKNIYVQVKSGASEVSRAKNKLEEWFVDYCDPETDHIWIALDLPRKGFLTYILTLDNMSCLSWKKKRLNFEGDLVDW